MIPLRKQDGHEKYFCDVNPYTGKKSFLYWNTAMNFSTLNIILVVLIDGKLSLI